MSKVSILFLLLNGCITITVRPPVPAHPNCVDYLEKHPSFKERFLIDGVFSEYECSILMKGINK